MKHVYTEEEFNTIISTVAWYEQQPLFAKPDREFVFEQMEAGEPTIYMTRQDKERWSGKEQDGQQQGDSARENH